jgi:hypothetical protein
MPDTEKRRGQQKLIFKPTSKKKATEILLKNQHPKRNKKRTADDIQEEERPTKLRKVTTKTHKNKHNTYKHTIRNKHRLTRNPHIAMR